MSEIILTSHNFEEIISHPQKITFVDFWAPWCGPCKMMGPIVEEIAKELPDIAVGKLNVDDCQDIAQKYNILSIPTFMIFKGGHVLDQFAGAMSKETLMERLQKHL